MIFLFDKGDVYQLVGAEWKVLMFRNLILLENSGSHTHKAS